MNRRRSKIALLALWVLAALALILFCIFRCCSAGGGTGEGDAGKLPDDPAPKWCGAPARYVASHADWSRSPCPATIAGAGGAWTASVLFSDEQAASGGATPPGTAAAPADAWTKLPPALRKYCVYTWGSTKTDGAAAPPDIASLTARANAAPTAVSPDCRVVSPIDSFSAHGCDAISDLDHGVCTTLTRQAKRAVDALDVLPAPPNGAAARRVRVAIVDTSPTGLAAPARARSPHGNAVGAVTTALACPGGVEACATKVVYQLAMPEIQGGLDYAKGGEFGSLGQIAVALWKAAAPSADYDALVLNVSLGWVHRDQSAGADLSPAEAAVKDALRFASCRGALIFAAAGNRSSAAAGEGGPLYPAAWEGEAQPGEKECASDFGEASALPRPDAGVIRRPNDKPPARAGREDEKLRLADGCDAGERTRLLYAVGGVDAEGGPLANARPGGRPRLAAYATAVTFPWPYHAPPGAAVDAPTMTGTSIATAMASGIAAVAWQLMDRTATAADVAALMYRSSSPVVANDRAVCADFPPASGAVRRLSLCLAATDACGDACKPRPTCNPATLDPSPLPLPHLATLGARPCTDDCPKADSASSASTDEPWGNPQPGGNVCDTCTGSMQAQTFVLDAILAGPVKGDAVLTVTDAKSQTSSFAIPSPPARFHVEVDAGALTHPVRATLSGYPTHGPPTYDPILMTPP